MGAFGEPADPASGECTAGLLLGDGEHVDAVLGSLALGSVFGVLHRVQFDGLPLLSLVFLHELLLGGSFAATSDE